MRRLNIRLLLVLIGSAAVFLIGIVVLHGYQVGRNAEVFKTVAYDFKEKGDVDQAVKNLQRYLRYRDDDVQATCDWAMWYADSIDAATSPNPESVRRVPLVLEQALRMAPDRDDIRRRLGRYYIGVGRVNDAMTHFNVLLEKKEQYANDGELRLLVGICQERDKNYEAARQSFEEAIKLAPQELDAYAALASLLAGPMEQPQEGDTVMNELVGKNPEDHRVYLMRYSYRQRHAFGTRADAKADLQKALELAPEEGDVIVKMAELLTLDREFQQARELLARGVELHPTDANMYIALALVELEEGRLSNTKRFEEALQHLLAGLKEAPDNTLLLMQIAELYIRREEYDSAEDTIAKLVELDLSQEQVDYLRSRVLIGEEKWAEASRLLLSLRQRSSRDPNVLFNIDMLLAQCYDALGQADMQLTALRRGLENNPYSVDARRKLIRVLQMLGRTDEVREEIPRLPGNNAQIDLELVRNMTAEQLARPVEERDWDEVDALVERIAADAPDGAEMALMKVRLLVYKGRHEDALKLATEQRERFPDSVGLWVAVADIEGLTDINRAIATLEEAGQRFKTPAVIQLSLTGKYVRLENKEEAAAKLQEIAKTVESYTLEEQRTLGQALGEALYSLEKFDAAKAVLTGVAERLPTDVTLRLMNFNLARDSRDEQGMADALQNLEQVVGKDHTYWQYCEAARLSTLVHMKKLDPKSLDEARRLVEKVVQTRPSWPAIVRLSAEIDDLDGRRNEAIKKYQQAAELGEASVAMIRRLVELLYLEKRFDEANEALGKMPTDIQLGGDFAKLKAELGMQEGDANLAAARAEKAVDPNSTNYREHLWQGQLFQRAGRRDDAEVSYRRAVQHGAQEPLCWVALISQLVQNGKRAEAEEQLSAMQAALQPEKLSMALGQCYEVLENAAEATKAYDLAVAQSPDDVAVLRSAAEFLVRSQQVAKAQAVLEKLVALAPQKTAEAEVKDVRWGRRTLAALVALSNSYADLRRALQILDANADGGGLSVDDKLIKAKLLGARNDLRSRREAIALYEEVLSKEPRRAADRFQLASLYERDANWGKCREHMLQLIGTDRESVLYIPLFANMLLRHGDHDDAARMLEKLEQIDPNAQITLAVKALLYARRGHVDQAIDITRELIVRPLAPQQVGKLLEVAQQFERLAATGVAEKEFVQAAEEMYQEYLQERPSEVFLMAVFQGKHGDMEQALTICEQNVTPENSANVAGLAMGILRSRRELVRADHMQRVEKLLLDAQQHKPDAVGVVLELSDLRGMQGNYAESAKLLRSIIDGPKASLLEKAAACNNLAYLLAVHDKNGKEALPLAEKAIAYFGPTAELLDTRGVVHATLEDYEMAVRDLSEAAQDSPDALKFFHLAWAHLKAGNKEAAKEAMQEATEKHQLNEQEISPLEREWLEQLKGL